MLNLEKLLIAEYCRDCLHLDLFPLGSLTFCNTTDMGILKWDTSSIATLHERNS